ncbi:MULTISPECIES: hypothetical protein [Streptomycetaceae]|uniref:Uncharacterized protein n=1 Tax=Streptantibioticus cattleyicolor (strain ATCC 35852 / DSM 46488 / JCM 4925 / NBRC 14057 / NRRL 8057) TaxID=1003195 RepID=F8K0M9_STREN|nr:MULTISPECIES: hypothetical protein [Streptomycetaceae]AEW94583.1 hypothetical protein SCATT_22120 [Streptantibioticus cattleyicolor NRRL 8057 = DSM 46488]MYS59221.1 hypothetical protein [Streptomyces sp. SID5468]CCB74941.1 conserved protein of unknown function [Streptantibioticus cattleyicolor NRRL 8057 = DSM 46488]
MNEPPTGVPAVDAAGIWCAAAVAIAGGLALLWRVVRAVRRTVHRVDDFIDDWQGVPPRPGVPARPGVMERLDRIEHRVGLVVHEVRPNSGSSLRDAVDRVDQRTARIAPDEP